MVMSKVPLVQAGNYSQFEVKKRVAMNKKGMRIARNLGDLLYGDARSNITTK